jgi:hypothetical protein
MTRASALALAPLFALAFASAPALAASDYRAEPARAPAETKIVLRDTIWNCTDQGCAAPKSNSRPAIVCALLVKEVGQLRSFSVGGEAMPADQLEKCNARAG